MFERVIIASGTSNRQTKALAASVRDSVKSRGMQVLSTEGEDNGEWIIVDCGAAVAHIMQPAIREYYHLEEIWGGKNVRIKIGEVSTKLVKASEPEPVAKPAAKQVAKQAAAKKSSAPRPPSKRTPSKAEVAQTAARKSDNRTAAFKRVAAKGPARSGAKTAAGKTTASKAAPSKSAASKTAARKAPARKATRG